MRSSPIQVGSGFYRTLALGNNSTMAIDPYGTLTAWGENLYGQAGTNTITSYSWTQLSNGDAHSLALRSDGTLYAWGLNTSGQLGTSDTVARQSPTQINANIGGVVTSNWTSVSAGASHTVAIASDGVAYGWGLNTSGQVGDITIVSRSAPVQIGIAGTVLNYSVLFNGTSQYLSVASNAAFALGTNPYTVEGWIYIGAAPGQFTIFGLLGGLKLTVVPAGFRIWANDGSLYTNANATINQSTWYHFALVRESTSLGKLYLNGVLIFTDTGSGGASPTSSAWITTNFTANDFYVGYYGGGFTNYFNGYISNLRVLKGTALYTSAFTPSVSPFSNIANTSLLTANALTIVDGSSNALAITNNGTATVSNSNPFIYYSGSFNGSNQSIQVANSGSILDFGTGNFTVEMWLYATSAVSNLTAPFVYGNYTNGASIPYFAINGLGGQIKFVYSLDGTTSNTYFTSGVTWNVNTWYHVAIVRNIDTISFYINGTVADSGNFAGVDFSGISGIRLGAGDAQSSNWISNYYFPGYISNFRAVKGTAVYTGNFTPPTNILRTVQASSTNITALTGTETVLLTLQNSTFVDNSSSNFTITNNNSSTISSTIAPFQASAPAAGTGYFIASKIAAGNNYTIAIKNDSTLYSWGLNTSYQLGQGDTTYRSSPVQVGTSSWSQISAGATHSLAIDINSLLYGWGTQTFGQLGLGDTLLRSQPTQIGASSWVAISAGYSHSTALTSDNRLFTWGNNTNGQLGFNMSFISISAGSSTTAVVRSDGTLWTWGANDKGQLGDNTSVPSRSSPVQVGTLTNWSKTTRASLTNFAIDNTGKLYGWGENTFGAIGDGTILVRSNPVQIGNSSWTMVATGGTSTAGQQTSYAIRSDGGLFAWGDNSYGQRGVGGAASPLSPVQIGTSSWSVVSGGNQFTMAITIDGKLYSWGRNDTGQLGISGSTTTFTWSKIVSSGTHTLAIRSDSRLFAWGLNNIGQLGDGTTSNRSSPVQVASGSYTQISAGLSNSYAIRSDGSLWTWGDNSQGSLGDPAAGTIGRSSPAQLGTDSWSLVSASLGLNYVLATRSDKTLYGWGNNFYGSLGNYTLQSLTNSNIQSPTQVSGGGSWNAISAGGSHTLAIKSDNKLYGWGLNNIGQTANNGTTFSWTKIASGALFSVAIRSDGLLFAWGNNQGGQLGFGDTVNRSSPTQVGTSSWSQIAAGDSHVVAVRSDSTLWSWGSNTLGQLGLVSAGNATGDTINRSSPVQIGSVNTWSKVSAAMSQSFAIRADASLYVWGNNALYGMLGFGDVANKSSPVQITVPLVSWSQIAAGNTSTAGIDNLGRLYTWGNNTGGQLGGAGNGSTAGSVAHRSSPSQVGATSWTAIATGLTAMAGVDNLGKLYTWGVNTSGELGDGNLVAVARSAPLQISTATGFSWTQVNARFGTVYAITTANVLWAWGLNNTSGGLGDGTTIGKSSMVTVTGGGTYVNAMPGSHGMAIMASTFALQAWGLNNGGQIGDNTVVAKSSPQMVGSSIPSIVNVPTIIGNSSWTSVSAGGSHSMAIRSDSTLFAWGRNTEGQLGLTDASTVGDGISRSSPVQVGLSPGGVTAGISSWTSVSTGLNHTMALRVVDGALFTWGFGTTGQLGSTALTSRSSPVQVGSISWTSISSGASTGVAIDNTNNIYTWGLGTSGQLGDNTGVTKSTPTKVGTLASTMEYSPIQVGSNSWINVSAGGSHTVGIKSDNTVFAWGYNIYGQLGDSSVVSRSAPVQVGTVTNTLTNANAYSTYVASTTLGYLTTTSSSDFALGDTFTVEFFCFLGTTSQTQYYVLDQGAANNNIRIIILPRTNDATIRFVTAGNISDATTKIQYSTWMHIAFVANSGTVSCYLNGVFTSFNIPITTANVTSTSGLTILNVGNTPSTANNFNNAYISNLRIVKGTAVYTSNFTTPSSPLTAITNTVLLTFQNTTLVDNSSSTKTLTPTGTISYGLLNTPFPSAVAAGALFGTQVSAGDSNTIALGSSNKLYGWGYNAVFGQLGLTNTINRSAPTQIGLETNWNNISAGGSHIVATDNTGTLYAWGINNQGQLGDPTISYLTNRSSPVQVTAISIPNMSSPTQVGSSSYSIVSAGNNTTAAISTDNKLFVWGLGTQGQLGIGNTIARSSPVQISTNSYNLVNAGGTHTTFVPNYSPQILLATGLNTSGQLGLYDIISRSSPVQIGASTSKFNSPVTVSTGNYSSYYVSSPTQVGSSSWTSVSAGGTHTLGVKKDYTLWAWGYNVNGQLGGSSTINRSSPVQVGTSSWSQVSAGDLHNVIAKSDGTINTFGLNTYGQLGDGT